MITTWIILAVLVATSAGIITFRPRGGMGIAWLLGLVTLYIGQRLLPGTTEGLVFSWVGVLVALSTLVARWRWIGRSDSVVRDAWRDSLIWQTAGTFSVVLWALTLPAVTSTLGLSPDTLARWTAVFSTVWPIVLLTATLPVLLLDVMLATHPVRMPEGARSHAILSGVTLGLGLTLVVPLNYLADAHDLDGDFSYFRVTRPGSGTISLLQAQQDPVDALLFFPPGNDVLRKIEPYFRDLAASSDGRLTVRTVDQAFAPVLSKDLGVRDNGHVVLRQGEQHQRFKLDTELKRARRALRKLDGTVQENLLKLVSTQRVAYITTGHGEASPRATNPFDKLGGLKKLLLSQNYEVKEFGLEEGSANDVPDDAALVIIAGPDKPFLEPEVAALTRYIDRGGSLLVYGEPGAPLDDVLSHIGVGIGEHSLAHASRYLKLTGGLPDRGNLYSQRFGSHPAVATLSKFATRAVIGFLGTAEVVETGDAAVPGSLRYSPLIRSHEDTWTDHTPNFERDEDEPTRVHVLALAVEGPPEHPFRAIVTGDVQVASDVLIERIQGNAQFLLDGVRWLVGEEEISGGTESEEDVRIEHTRESDVAWFYGTIFGVPLLVLGSGAFLVRRRRRGGRNA